MAKSLCHPGCLMDITDRKDKKEAAKAIKEVKEHHQLWIGSYVLLALGCLAIHFLLRLHVLGIIDTYRPMLKRLSLAAFLIFLVLTLSKYAQALLVKYSHARAI